MLADFFTKPLQGQLFRKLRDELMGVKWPNVPSWTTLYIFVQSQQEFFFEIFSSSIIIILLSLLWMFDKPA
jgi:hypothetical protein